MIKHIVLFKLKKFDSATAKAAKMEDLKAGLLALEDKIDALKSIEVGLNSNPDEDFDIALSTTFDDMEGLESYARHPDHLAVGKILREVLEARSCVDYHI